MRLRLPPAESPAIVRPLGVAVLDQPAVHREAVVDRRWKRVFGRKPIVDEQTRSRFARTTRRRTRIGGRQVEAPRAAVQVEQGAARRKRGLADPGRAHAGDLDWLRCDRLLHPTESAVHPAGEVPASADPPGFQIDLAVIRRKALVRRARKLGISKSHAAMQHSGANRHGGPVWSLHTSGDGRSCSRRRRVACQPQPRTLPECTRRMRYAAGQCKKHCCRRPGGRHRPASRRRRALLAAGILRRRRAVTIPCPERLDPLVAGRGQISGQRRRAATGCLARRPGNVLYVLGDGHEPRPWTPAILRVRERVERLCGLVFNSVLLNRYRDGRDGMGWHADDEPGSAATRSLHRCCSVRRAGSVAPPPRPGW